MTMITHLNYDTLLKESTTARGATPNGNVYFDVANNEIQLIGADELATVDFGAGAVTNPLNNADGITLRALYNFENQQRRTNETLRKYKRGTDGDYRFAGAFSFINGVTLDGTDRAKIRNSGFIEYDAAGDGATTINRIYHGVKSLNSIQAGTTSYWTLVTAADEATLQAATWADFGRTGAIDEVVQVFGAAAHGNFDYTTRILVVRTRSWGYNSGETTSVLTGIAEFSGYSAGYGIGETLNSNNAYALADVYGGAKIAPWTGMSLEKLAVAQVETGFNEANGSFTWVLNNTGGGTVQQCAAYLDAVALQDADVDGAVGTSYNGKKGRVWYSRDTSGKVVTSQGLFIEGLATSEKQSIIMTDDAGSQKTYPFFVDVQITVGSAAVADANAWYHVFYVDGAAAADFDTTGAVTVNDAAGNPVKGNVATDAVANKISFSYAYDTNTQAGLAGGIDKDMVVLVEGDGGAAQAIAFFTVTENAVVPVTCAPTTDTNA